MGSAPLEATGPKLFNRLGRYIVKHPWHFVIFWIALLLVSVPFLQYLGGVTTNSTTTLPASSPSSLAQAEFDRLFPNETGGSSSDLVLAAPNMTDANAQSVVLNVTAALLADPQLKDIASIDSFYTDFALYLSGDLQLGSGALQAALSGATPLPAAVNDTAGLLWGPPATFLTNWEGFGANASANYPAYQATEATYSSSPPALAVLGAFYNGAGASAGGFNGSLACAQNPPEVVNCTDHAVRLNVPSLFPTLFPTPEASQVAESSVTYLDVTNFTSWPSVRFVVVEVVGTSVGLPPSWLITVWDDFPSSVPSPTVALAWANATVKATTFWHEPVPVPYSLSAEYIAPGLTAQLVVVTYSVSDSATGPGGSTPVYSDIDRINAVIPSVVRASDPTHSISFFQTGPSPLDQSEQTVVNAAIQLVLPITVVVLILITAFYFRSPITPLVAFAALAVALVLGLGGTVLLGTLITHVDTTSLTLEEVFVLGVGTDYSIFLISRYREEVIHGTPSREAMVTSVTWAGQSIATSGMTAVIATLALTFSGIALLSQWGMVLSLSVLMTILISLTLIPALVTLVGPRLFWPLTRERFERHANHHRTRTVKQQTYFYRAAALTRRRPVLIIAVILVVTAPLLYVALGVPVSYDFYSQLPSSQPAVQGLNELSQQYGAGFAFPTTALVTFSSPLLVGNHTNASEFASLAALTSLAENTSGVAVVQSLVGPFGAPLATWQNLSSAPVSTQVHLEALASSFVGTDQRTVLLTVQTTQSGLSGAAIGVLTSIESSFGSYSATHTSVTQLAYLGGASVTNDLAIQAAAATERLLLAVAIALIVVLFVVLRSWVIPLLAVATIGLSIAWSWGLTYLVLDRLFGVSIFFFVPTLMFILILGLGIDYNIFLLSRIREERLRGRTSADAISEGLARTGGIITAAAIILAGAFATLMVGSFALLVAIGFSVAVAVLLDAMVVRTYLVPSVLQILGDRVWRLPGRKRAAADLPTPASAPAPAAPKGE